MNSRRLDSAPFALSSLALGSLSLAQIGQFRQVAHKIASGELTALSRKTGSAASAFWASPKQGCMPWELVGSLAIVSGASAARDVTFRCAR